MRELDEIVTNIRRNTSFKNKDNYECAECKDTGWITYNDEMGRPFTKKCKCHEMREVRRYIEQSRISEEFQTKGFGNFDTRNIPQLIDAKSKAMEYYKSFCDYEHTRNNSILFYGQVGAGKTHLGTAIAANLMRRGIPVTYMPYRNVTTKIKQVITDSEEYSRELLRFTRCRVLFVDDLLKGKITQSDVNIMYELVNYRYMNNLPFIISTERSLQELLDFDEAVSSRIIEMCRGNIVKLQGKELNYRLYS